MIQPVLILYYITGVNVLSLITMGIDKIQAIKGKGRIPESTLLMFALLGGGAGFSLSMVLFRHKLSKVRFRIIAGLSVAVYWMILFLYIYSETVNV